MKRSLHSARRSAAVFLAALCLFAFSAAPDCLSAEKPAARVARIRDLGTIPVSSRILGRDGGYSALFRGRSVWVYGDTLVGRNRRDPLLLSNSCSWTRDADAADGIAGFVPYPGSGAVPQQFIPFTAAEEAFNRSHCSDEAAGPSCSARWAVWPGALMADTAKDRLLLFYKKVLVQPGFLNFQIAGQGIAAWSAFDRPPQRIRTRGGANAETLLFGKDEPAFGSAAVAVGATVYVYGCSQEGFAKPCRVGRVALDRISERSAWEFYAGPQGWQNEIEGSEILFDGNDMLSVSYNPYLESYLAVYSRPMSRTVLMRSAPAPTGPWSEPLPLFEAQPPQNDIGWVYDALEHAEYARRGGREIYITYSRQTGPLTFELRLVAVALEKF